MVTRGLTESIRESLQVPGQTPETAHGPQSLDSKANQARQITTLSLPNSDLARGRTVCNQRLEEAFISIRAYIHESNQSRAFADPTANTVGGDTVGRSKEPAALAAKEQEQ